MTSHSDHTPVGLLAEKVVFVTGASRGIGAAAARLFAREGTAVVLAAGNVEALERVVAQVRSAEAALMRRTGGGSIVNTSSIRSAVEDLASNIWTAPIVRPGVVTAVILCTNRSSVSCSNSMPPRSSRARKPPSIEVPRPHIRGPVRGVSSLSPPAGSWLSRPSSGLTVSCAAGGATRSGRPVAADGAAEPPFECGTKGSGVVTGPGDVSVGPDEHRGRRRARCGLNVFHPSVPRCGRAGECAPGGVDEGGATGPEQLGEPDRLSVVDDVIKIQGFGAPAFALGWPTLFLDTPHTGTALDILRGVGAAILVIGAMLGIATVLRPVAARFLRPLRATGGAPLSVYALHLTTLAVAANIGPEGPAQAPTWYQVGPGAFVLSVAVALVFGTVLAVLGRRGPLEWAASSVARGFGAMTRNRRPISGNDHAHGDQARTNSLKGSDADFTSTHHVKEKV